MKKLFLLLVVHDKLIILFLSVLLIIDVLQEPELLIFLRDQLESRDKELFLVVEKHIDDNQTWLLPESHTNYIDCDPDDRSANCLTLSQLSEFGSSTST